MGDSVYFLTGTDEHGQKVQQTARRRGALRPSSSPTRSAREFRAMLPRLEISNDDFIRTTEERHKRVVREHPPAAVRPGRHLPRRVPRVLQHAAGAVPPGEGPPARRLLAGDLRRGDRDRGAELLLQAARLPGLAGRFPREERGLHLPAVPPEAGGRIPEGAAERPVHLAPQGAAGVGDSAALRRGVRDLRLVRRPRELLLRRGRQARRLARRPGT